MFSGIVEATTFISQIEKRGSVYQILVQKPESYTDLSIGDSISVNGVCLTVEKIQPETLQFSLGPETLRTTKWNESLNIGSLVNMERSLRFGDRIHGHMVTGHVDTAGRVLEVLPDGDSLFFSVEIPEKYGKYIWKKGSACISGVSLTVNDFQNNIMSFTLIPETLRKTNLRSLKEQDIVNVEFDFMAKSLVNFQEKTMGQMLEKQGGLNAERRGIEH